MDIRAQEARITEIKIILNKLKPGETAETRFTEKEVGKTLIYIRKRLAARRFQTEPTEHGVRITRLDDDQSLVGAVGRPVVYTFDTMAIGDEQVFDLPRPRHMNVRTAVDRAVLRTGHNLVATANPSGGITVRRLAPGAVPEVARRGPPRSKLTEAICSLEPGGKHQVASAPDVNVQSIRNAVAHHGARLGRKFSVTSNGLGGCTITRVDDGADSRPDDNAPPRIRPIPEAPPPPPPAQRSAEFDTEEF